MSVISEDLAGLSSAEEFLKFLDISFDPHIVSVNRLHILKRFNVYLAQIEEIGQLSATQRKEQYRAMLLRAYNDFVDSSARAEKVFPVFTRGGRGFVALSALKPVSRI